ncbi:hypothetical protein T492DRAFT_903531 [Pavlovales sp. CCMP2436]|nr:hypothetical protein T492DRAFT_903531 [Pavlovales sp. CCMP2436]
MWRSTLAGAVFPAYKSFKALRTNDEEETQKWLKYWVIYVMFVVVQIVTDLVLTWCVAPSSLPCCVRGAALLRG